MSCGEKPDVYQIKKYFLFTIIKIINTVIRFVAKQILQFNMWKIK